MKKHTWIIVLVIVAAVVALVAVRMRTAPVGQQLPQVYSNSAMGFSVRLPIGYVTDEEYQYQELGPGKYLSMIKFIIPTSVATSTNLASDTFLSVEELPYVTTCTASFFLGETGGVTNMITDGNTTYSVASSTGAAAGNRYEETVYALPGTNPCIAVRYFIHYGVIENYPPGAVREFDRAALLATFDAIRRSLLVAKTQ